VRAERDGLRADLKQIDTYCKQLTDEAICRDAELDAVREELAEATKHALFFAELARDTSPLTEAEEAHVLAVAERFYAARKGQP